MQLNLVKCYVNLLVILELSIVLSSYQMVIISLVVVQMDLYEYVYLVVKWLFIPFIYFPKIQIIFLLEVVLIQLLS
ncbi:unnamed protein product [Trichobilharzia regenti]|nr:unnamed protein product [Trichobilharzia regenti]